MDTLAATALEYQTGFANAFESEAIPGALPVGRNSPQKVPFGLYAEQLSGTAFTASQDYNRRSWLYRIRPSVRQGRYARIDNGLLRTAPVAEADCPPDQMRWDPLPPTGEECDFVDGLTTLAAAGDLAAQTGMAAHVYCAGRSMEDRFFCNADGEMLIVPQQGRLLIATEFGAMLAAPGEIAVIQRGIRFRVELPDGPTRGYVCENYGSAFRLPERGPIGANGLANPRDFQSPVARYEDREGAFEIVTKFQGNLWAAPIGHSPLDVVAWHGNYVPYKYDLAAFNAIGTVSFDHPDPSIYTVLTSPSDLPGTANVDFVIFPPRWLVAEDTFRPPWFHRNAMSEFMGLRPVRRQGRGFRAGRGEPAAGTTPRQRVSCRAGRACTTRWRRTGRTRTPTPGRSPPSSRRNISPTPWRSCSRPAMSAGPPRSRSTPRRASATTRIAGRTCPGPSIRIPAPEGRRPSIRRFAPTRDEELFSGPCHPLLILSSPGLDPGIQGSLTKPRHASTFGDRIKRGEEPIPPEPPPEPTVADLAELCLKDHVAVRCKPRMSIGFEV